MKFFLTLILFCVLSACSNNLQKPPSLNLNKCRTNSLVLVVDKSRSVNDRQLVDYEKDAIKKILPRIKSNTELSIVAFDSVPFIVVNKIILNNKGKKEAAKRLNNIFASGQTNIELALLEAEIRLKRSDRDCKNMVVMTDAKFAAPLFINEDMIKGKRIGVDSAFVMLGNDGDYASMKKLANMAGGEFYRIINLNSLDRALVDILSSMNQLD